ncbi:putative amidohydrolase / Aliphatic amidase AmiE [Candidatus Syntrophocurvum alkaliphilum]|uniref:Putative amidohydrolase / Aliphatic amidase AmiE n=1 Tax=Candidatus Syntrophocurvum alkaliphilum TaxID=2293317 RepID=A0A6I6DB01_9FIRM|nr:carbon-nitrogen hydrolase family protein [Candidatus Syntrophocurvum alkaliphilum]QGT99865.1 putative amidohydrolase / Aliphatic amidase AmiE [Candidatus Syntrophocurvum alkaliphilum]
MNILAAICQMKVGSDKKTNLSNAQKIIQEAAKKGADMVVLPEVFNSPYQTDLFPAYAEPFGGETTKFLSEMAREHKVLLVGGSIVEKDNDDKIYNTSYVFDANGNLVNKHRKVHLFDIDIPGKIKFQESETLSAGNTIEVFKYKGIGISVMICYDGRFPELARIAALNGAQIIIIPGAFNLTTGPLHWELIMRSRAVDNQVFVVAAAPSRNPDAGYQAWGHSMIVNPWGTIIAQTDEGEGIVMGEIDLDVVNKVRQEIPVLSQRRNDLYQVNYYPKEDF